MVGLRVAPEVESTEVAERDALGVEFRRGDSPVESAGLLVVALVSSLPSAVPHREEVRAMVFGVAVFGTAVQGLFMPFVLRETGVTN